MKKSLKLIHVGRDGARRQHHQLQKHPQKIHGEVGAHLTAAETETGDKRSTSRPSPPPPQPCPAHQTPGAHRHRRREPRRGEEGTPAPLFHRAAAAPTSPAPPEDPTLLYTRLRHESEVPPPSGHLNGDQRGRGTTDRPSAEDGIELSSLFSSPYCSTRG